MALSEDIVKRIDQSHKSLEKINNKIDTDNYSDFYQDIWLIRAEIEYIVAALKLVNNLADSQLDGKWKKDFSDSLVQIRAVRKVKGVLKETLELFWKLEQLDDIIEFYKVCWMIKEKLTIALNVVKPKHKLKKK